MNLTFVPLSRQAAVQHQVVENLHRLLQLSPHCSHRCCVDEHANHTLMLFLWPALIWIIVCVTEFVLIQAWWKMWKIILEIFTWLSKGAFAQIPPCHFHNLLSCTTRTSNKTNDFQWTRRSSAAMGGCHQICRAWSRSGEKTFFFPLPWSWSITIGHGLVMAMAFVEQDS